jgi:hypothetical protein
LPATMPTDEVIEIGLPDQELSVKTVYDNVTVGDPASDRFRDYLEKLRHVVDREKRTLVVHFMELLSGRAVSAPSGVEGSLGKSRESRAA